MKKIPTLFHRVFHEHRLEATVNAVDEELKWVLDGEGTATVKYDGACCAVIGGTLYKRYDAKRGKPVPTGAIKCQEEADPVTGHLSCWVKVDEQKAEDKWFCSAFENSGSKLPDGTYEAVGKHFQGNPYKLPGDILVPHGEIIIDVERTFDGIKAWLTSHNAEGIVFWKDGNPVCKIKRRDFGLPWPDPKAVPVIENDNIRYRCICEVCGKTEILSAEEAYVRGWDYPPAMYSFGIISPRTCENCTIEKTLWWKVACEKKTISDLTEKEQKTLERITNEPESIITFIKGEQA